jgi:hypothetical protein
MDSPEEGNQGVMVGSAAWPCPRSNREKMKRHAPATKGTARMAELGDKSVQEICITIREGTPLASDSTCAFVGSLGLFAVWSPMRAPAMQFTNRDKIEGGRAERHQDDCLVDPTTCLGRCNEEE